jgi:tetratricopeptide (TPR) repeat protein
MAFIGIGKPAWARPELERLAAAVPDNPVYPYWLARVDYDEHKYDASIARLRAVTKAVPQFARAWDNLGLSLEATGKLDEAVAVYRQAVELNREQKTHSPWPPLNLATLLTKMGDVAGAEPLLREAILYEPGLGEAHYRLGVNLKKQNRGRDAVSELKKATELDPNATEPLYALGQLYREQGDEAAATQAFEKFRELKKKQRGS